MAFQSLLKEVFTATVQNEEEFTYCSATLAVASIFQLYARAPGFALYQQRVTSFNTFLALNSRTGVSGAQNFTQLPSASEFASTGFFHTGRTDETVCGACGLGLRDWKPADQADMAHASFAKERTDCCSLPCLFLDVHRFLTSDLPLARKKLFNENGSMNGCSRLRKDPEVAKYVVNLADRLRAIALMMASSPHASAHWPVLNARDLGYSDDLIALALWRLQSDAAPTPTSAVSPAAMTISPQCTTLLLKSILWVQESGLDDDESEPPEDDSYLPSTPLREAEDEKKDEEVADEDASSSISDDVELQALSMRRTVGIVVGTSTTESSTPLSLKASLPALAQILLWWFTRFPESPVEL